MRKIRQRGSEAERSLHKDTVALFISKKQAKNICTIKDQWGTLRRYIKLMLLVVSD